MTTVACQHCGVCFDTPEWRLRQGKGKYCGKVCANQAMQGFHAQYPVEYMAYHDAKRRCTNPYHLTNQINYKDRGIKFLLKSFEDFILHVGPRPIGTSLDRIDNNGNYEIGNLRWATQQQQCQNKSNNKFFTFNGETLCAAEWDRKLGLANGSVARRINKYNWPVEKALSTPGRSMAVLPAY